MSEMTRPFIKRPPRYDVRKQHEIVVSMKRGEESSEPLEASLVNISEGGAQFAVNQMPQPHEVLAVNIEAPGEEVVIAISAEVCWVNPSVGEEWSFGSKFEPAIPIELLHQLAAAGIIERREHEREPVAQVASAQWELNQESADVTVLNHSRGGFCLLASEGAKPGDRLQLKIATDDDQQIEIHAKARWHIKSSEGDLVGCQFLRARDFRIWSDFMEASMWRDNMSPSPSSRGWLKWRNMSKSEAEPVEASPASRWYIYPTATIAAGLLVMLCLRTNVQPMPVAMSGLMVQPSVAVDAVVATNAEARSPKKPDEAGDREALDPDTSDPETSDPETSDRNAMARHHRVQAPVVSAEQEEVPPGFRVWTDSTGQFQVVARAVTFDGDQLRLKKPNGRIKLVTLERLSRDDVQYVRENIIEDHSLRD